MAQESQFQCSGNCLNCLPAQRAYCASQHAYSNMKVLDALMNEIISIKDTLKALTAEAVQPIAQEGAGAVTIDAPKKV